MTNVSSIELTKPESLTNYNAVQTGRRLYFSAQTACEVGQQKRAAELYESCIQKLGKGGEEFESGKLRIYALEQLAEIRRSQGHYPEAEPLLREALSSAEQIFGSNAIEVSTAANNLAVLYKYMGRFTDAGLLYQRALSILERVFGSDHPEVATIYHNLGGLEHAAGNYSRGEPFARRSVEIREQALGPDHPDTAADMAALAALLDGQGKYAESEPLYRKALAVFERVYGPEHYEIAINLNNLAAAAHAQGKKDEAERLYRRALAIKQKVLGPEHPDVAMTLNNLAVFFKSNHDYAQAELLYKQSLSIFEKTLGPDHSNVAVCLSNYVQLLLKMDRKDEARVLKTRADAIRSGLGLLKKNDVVATATINSRYTRFALAVRRSEIDRWGVFAEECIPARRKVIEYTGKRITLQEAGRQRRTQEYWFTVDKNWCIDGAVGGSGAELINHSCDPNLYACLVKGHILYMSKREIQPGEELTVDYRFSADVPQKTCHCGSPKCRGTINVRTP